MKKIVFTPAARADVRRIDRETAMRILTALDHFARTGEGDVKKLQGNTSDLRLRVGDYRIRFIENPPGTLYIHAVCTAPKPTAEPISAWPRTMAGHSSNRGRTTSDRGRVPFDLCPAKDRLPARLARRRKGWCLDRNTSPDAPRKPAPATALQAQPLRPK